MSGIDYQSKIIAAGYQILANDNFKWDSEFTDEMKTELLEFMLTYYESIDEWDNCIKLKKMIDELRGT